MQHEQDPIKVSIILDRLPDLLPEPIVLASLKPRGLRFCLEQFPWLLQLLTLHSDDETAAFASSAVFRSTNMDLSISESLILISSNVAQV
jgi:hypothetical protein